MHSEGMEASSSIPSSAPSFSSRSPFFSSFFLLLTRTPRLLQLRDFLGNVLDVRVSPTGVNDRNGGAPYLETDRFAELFLLRNKSIRDLFLVAENREVHDHFRGSYVLGDDDQFRYGPFYRFGRFVHALADLAARANLAERVD